MYSGEPVNMENYLTRIAFVSTFPPEPVNSGFSMRISGILNSVPSDYQLLKIFPQSLSAKKYPPDVSFTPCRVSRLRELFSMTPRIMLSYTGSKERKTVTQAIKEFRPDCLVASGLHVFPFIPKNLRIVYDSHNIEWHLSKRFYELSKGNLVVKLHRYLTSQKLQKCENSLALRSDFMIACSSTDAEYFSSIRNEPVPVVPNGVDIDYWNIPRIPQKGVILFSGDMSYYPNIEAAEFLANEILPILREIGWNGSLVLCGRDPSTAVQRLAADSVIVTGSVDDLREYYSRAEVLIAPMRIGSGTPLKVITAMAAGVPVITTSRIVKSLGLSGSSTVIEADQPEEIAKKVLEISNNPLTAARYSQAGKRIAKEMFSWPVVGKAFWQQIDTFLKNSL